MSTVHEATSGPFGHMSRRDLIRLGLLGALGLFLLETLGTFLVFFWPRKIGVFGSKVTIGPPDQFALASITTFQQAKMFVSHVPEGFLALYWKCPHLGCTVQWHPEEPTEDTLAQAGRFHCPCHGSIYDRHGQIISGPAPRPMDTFKLSVEGGKLVADTSIVEQRAHWQPDQALKA